MTKEEKEQKRQAQIQMLAVNAGITPEHLELLQQGFKEHDFTVSVPLPVTKPKRREKQPADAKKKAAENAKANAGQTNDSAAPSDDSVMDADRKTAVRNITRSSLNAWKIACRSWATSSAHPSPPNLHSG